ncbi:MAG: hypothetical protein JO113_05080, partial [Candidatus Eremiobacteraeota bacterium]|nr:hypothetical protein [Candidatus Eremiobacteraeota bacterium]
MQFTHSMFVANVRTDPNQFRSCRINRTDTTFLSCEIPQYDSAHWNDAVKNIEQALPPGFQRFNLSLSPTSRQFVWVRHSDTMTVELVESFGNQPLSVWIQQMNKVPASPATVDADAAPIPIFATLRASSTIAVGLVIAQDAAKSYILTTLSYPTKPLYAGTPFAPGVWREVPADLVAQDPSTNLTLLSVPRLSIRPHALIANVAQGEQLVLLNYGRFGNGGFSNCNYAELVDAVDCTLVRGPGIVAAVHEADHEFEHSSVPFDGAPLADAASHRIVGVSLSSSPKDGS